LVQIITKANRSQFVAELDGMHRDRKRVFVDWLKWSIPVTEGTHEIDQFDTDDAVYLIESDGSGRHLASIRLLRTSQPHLLADVFPNLCDGPIPVGSHIWELTRFCVAPDMIRTDGVRLMNLMWTSVVEYAVLNHIAQYTCVTHMAFLSQILSAGWDTTPLGLPKMVDGGLIGAVLFRISPATLQEARSRYGYQSSVFEAQSEAA
jgi:N-acyl-L-homoserine lactone synthetase